MHYVRKLCTVIDWLLLFFAGNTMRVRKEHTCAIREQEFQILAAKNTMKAQAYTTPKALNDIYHEARFRRLPARNQTSLPGNRPICGGQWDEALCRHLGQSKCLENGGTPQRLPHV